MPDPPDLSGCTRLEVRPYGGAMLRFFWGTESLFNAEETEYIRSCDTWVVEDPDLIKVFAQAISRGQYCGQGSESLSPGPEIICYRNGTRIASLTDVSSTTMTTDKGEEFRYPPRLLDMSIPIPAGIERLKPRARCASRLMGVCSCTIERGRIVSYADPDRWCDVRAEKWRRKYHSTEDGPRIRTYPEERIARKFRCPTMHSHLRADADESRDGTNDARSDDKGGAFVDF